MTNTKPQIRRFNPVDGEFFIVCDKDGGMIGKAYDLKSARLIAAAPELLEALEYSLKVGLHQKMAMDAIAKAKGEL